jgi:hypothetical protein
LENNMTRFTVFLLVLSLALLTACASNQPAAQENTAATAATLKVSGGDTSKEYTRADLEALPASPAVFKGVTYKGVPVSALLQDAGFDLAQVKAVKAIAQDGYTLNYDPSQVLVDEVILAYARLDGDLAEEDGSFRMVLPGAEGKLNVRMLVELQVIK